MKYTPARTVYVPATYLDRFVVEQDTAADCPLEWGWDGETQLIRQAYLHHSTLSDYDSDSDLMRAFVELVDRHDVETAQKVVKRRLGVDVKILNLQGYSQGHWVDLAYFGEVPTEGLQSWFCGDVYGVEDLETGESLWGIYEESMEDAAKHYAINYAGLTEEEWDNYGNA